MTRVAAGPKGEITFDVGYPFTDEHGMFVVSEGCAFDSEGYGPFHWMPGCANCGAGKGWGDPMQFVGMLNAGQDPSAPRPCSRKCALQLEYAAELAARKSVESGGHS